MKILLIVFVIMLSGCVVESDVPIRDGSGNDLDTRLSGAWRGGEEDQLVFLHFGVYERKGKVIAIEHAKDAALTSTEYPVITAILGQRYYASVFFNSENKPRYLLLRYEIEESDKLVVTHVSNEFLKKAISTGLVRGEFDNQVISPSGVLHASEAELKEFVVKFGEKLFSGEKVVFFRVK